MKARTQYGITVSSGNRKTSIASDDWADDVLTAKSAQLRGLMALVGSGEEGFRSLDKTLQEEVIWLACTLSNEVHLLACVATSQGD